MLSVADPVVPWSRSVHVTQDAPDPLWRRTVAVDSEVSVRTRLVVAIVFLWLWFVLPRAAAAQTVAVAGIVTDPQGGVVVGASVTLTTATASNVPRPITARTDAAGAFSLAVGPVRYTLQIDSPGFVTWMQDVVVDAAMASIRVTLQIAGVLEDVQVSGTAPYNLTKPIPTASRLGLAPLDTPASVAVVSGDVIRALETPTLRCDEPASATSRIPTKRSTATPAT
jgi:hypothetical protein